MAINDFLAILYDFFFDVEREPNKWDYLYRIFCVLIIICIIKKMLGMRFPELNFDKELENLRRQQATLRLTQELMTKLHILQATKDSERQKRELHEFMNKNTTDQQRPVNTNLFPDEISETKCSTSVIEETVTETKSPERTKNIALDVTNKTALRSLNQIGKKIDQFKFPSERSVVQINSGDFNNSQNRFDVFTTNTRTREDLMNKDTTSFNRESIKNANTKLDKIESRSDHILTDLSTTRSVTALTNIPRNQVFRDNIDDNTGVFDQNKETKNSSYDLASNKVSLTNTIEQNLNSPSRSNKNMFKHSMELHQKLPVLKRSHSSLILNTNTQNTLPSPRARINESNLNTSNQNDAGLISNAPCASSCVSSPFKWENNKKAPQSNPVRIAPAKGKAIKPPLKGDK